MDRLLHTEVKGDAQRNRSIPTCAAKLTGKSVSLYELVGVAGYVKSGQYVTVYNKLKEG